MKDLTQSLEKYLSAINELIDLNTAARVKDVAASLAIGMASTSEAVKTLASRGYINYQPYGIITMTSKGKKAVQKKMERHRIICDFLEKVLMMAPENVEESAKNIEFSMTEDVLQRFVDYITFMQCCSCKEPKWIKSFQYFIQEGKMQEKCLKCSKAKERFDNSKCCGCS